VNVAPYELCEEFQTLQEAMEREWEAGTSPSPLGDYIRTGQEQWDHKQRIEQLIRWSRNLDAEYNGVIAELDRLNMRRRGVMRRRRGSANT
jgi:hypothetical protein